MKSLADHTDGGEKIQKYSDVKWARASDIYKNPHVFSHGIEPNDVGQGNLGNCYFLAVCSAMAEDPDSVKACFVTQEVNSAGIYLMKFYINGI
jgi:hypothetical protein